LQLQPRETTTTTLTLTLTLMLTRTMATERSTKGCRQIDGIDAYENANNGDENVATTHN